MRPNMPPRLGLLGALFCAVVVIAFFGSSLSRTTVQAQDNQPADGVSAAAPAETSVTESLDDLIIGIQNSEPTYVNESITLSATLNITDTTGLSFSWQFGDTQTANGRGVEHTYNSEGLFIVRLFVLSRTEQREVTKPLNVIKRPIGPPVKPEGAKIEVIDDNPQALEAQRSINFLATVAKGTNVRYLWQFSDTPQRLTGSSVTRSFDQPGQYTLYIEALNELGSAFAELTVNIGDAPPEELSFTYDPKPIKIEDTILFTAHQKRGTRLVYEWQFFDGQPLKRGRIVAHTFTEPGPHAVQVTAWNQGDTKRVRAIEYSETIIAEAEAPSGLRVIQDSPKKVKTPVSFLVFVRSQADLTLQYEWGDRGRLIKDMGSPPPGHLYQDETTKAYSEEGMYPVLVIASNDYGITTTGTVVYIDVDSPVQYKYKYTYTKPVLPGTPLNFAIAENVDGLDCKWIFTDPLADREKRNSVRNGKAVTYSFTRSGAHVVTIDCRTPANTPDENKIVKVENFYFFVGGYTYLPLISYKGAANVSGPRQPIVTPTNTPVPPATATPTPTETPQPPPTLLPSPTATPSPTASSTVTPAPPTPTVTPTSTLILTAPAPTATPTQAPGGTIPGG